MSMEVGILYLPMVFEVKKKSHKIILNKPTKMGFVERKTRGK
jgi:hypothetical protein